MSSDCIGISEAIWDSARLGAELTGAVRSHIQHCASCTETLAQAEASVSALRCVKPYPVAPDCRDRVMSWVSGRRRVAVLRRFAWSTVPAAVGIALLMALYPGGQPEQGTRQPEIARKPVAPEVRKQADRAWAYQAPVRKPLLAPRPGAVQVAMAAPETRERFSYSDVDVEDSRGEKGVAVTPTEGESAAPESEHRFAWSDTATFGDPSSSTTRSYYDPAANGTYDGPVEGKERDTPAAGVAERDGGPVAHGRDAPNLSPVAGDQPVLGKAYLSRSAGLSAQIGEGTRGVQQAPPEAAGNADTEQPQLLRDVHEAKLGQIALVVKDLSQGKSRLLIGQGASADPQVGGAFRETRWGGLPLISAYPVSEPVKTKLRVGDCVVLGAVTLLVPAEPPGARESNALGRIPMAPAGVYLLAYTGEFSDKEEESGTISLMSVSVDKDGNAVFQQVLGVPATRHTRRGDVIYGGEDWYGAAVQFPDKDQLSKENPAWRATVTLALHEPDGRYRSHRFQLDLQITML